MLSLRAKLQRGGRVVVFLLALAISPAHEASGMWFYSNYETGEILAMAIAKTVKKCGRFHSSNSMANCIGFDWANLS